MNLNTYKIICKDYGIITMEKEGLTFDEAYQLATPDYTRAIFPDNFWHIRMKYSIYKFFEDSNNKLITVNYKTKDQNSDIKIKEFIMMLN